MEICYLFQLMCPPGRQYNWKHFCGYCRIPILWKILDHIWFIKWCKCQVCAACNLIASPISNLTAFSEPTISPSSVAKLIFGSVHLTLYSDKFMTVYMIDVSPYISRYIYEFNQALRIYTSLKQITDKLQIRTIMVPFNPILVSANQKCNQHNYFGNIITVLQSCFIIYRLTIWLNKCAVCI